MLCWEGVGATSWKNSFMGHNSQKHHQKVPGSLPSSRTSHGSLAGNRIKFQTPVGEG